MNIRIIKFKHTTEHIHRFDCFTYRWINRWMINNELNKWWEESLFIKTVFIYQDRILQGRVGLVNNCRSIDLYMRLNKNMITRRSNYLIRWFCFWFVQYFVTLYYIRLINMNIATWLWLGGRSFLFIKYIYSLPTP